MRWFMTVGLVAVTSACQDGPYSKHSPFPDVPTLDGGVLSPLHLVTIVPSNDADDAPAFFDYSNTIGASVWWDRLTREYALGGVGSSRTLMGPTITADIADHEIFQYIEALVASTAGVAPDGKTLYLLYLPPNVAVVSDGVRNTDCQKFGGYHHEFGIRGDNLAVIQRCAKVDPVDNMTIAASHEIAEAVTDPSDRGYRLPVVAAQAPWTETIWNAFEREGGAELGDLCEGTYWQEGRRVYQRIWSNAAARKGGDPCIPKLNEPYYGVDFEQDWYPIVAGGRVAIPVRGWATGSVGAWPLATSVEGGAISFTATFSTNTVTLTAGAEVDLQVAAPPGTKSGSYAVVRVASRRPPVPAGARGLTDGAHVSFVGVYVP